MKERAAFLTGVLATFLVIAPGFANMLDQRSGSALSAPASGSMTALPGAAASRGLSFDAHSTATGGSLEGGRNPTPINTNNNNGVGQFATTRTRKTQTGLEISVRNTSSKPDNARIDWFFVAEDEGDNKGNNIFVWDHGEREVAVAAVGQAREVVKSTELTSTVTRTITRTNTGTPAKPFIRTTTSEQKSGARLHGWIVRMFVDGQLARVQASSGAMEQLGRNPALLDRVPKRAGK